MKTLRTYRELRNGEFIVIFCDTAWGGPDYCAGQFLSTDRLDVPMVYHSKSLATEMTPIIHHQAEKIYQLTGLPPVVCFERNNGGTAEMERLAALNRLGKYTIYQEKTGEGTTNITQDSPRLGLTTGRNRSELLGNLKYAIDNRLIGLYDTATISELTSFVEVQTSTSWKAQAESGAHDDLVMSLAGAWHVYLNQPRPSLPTPPPRAERMDFSIK